MNQNCPTVSVPTAVSIRGEKSSLSRRPPEPPGGETPMAKSDLVGPGQSKIRPRYGRVPRNEGYQPSIVRAIRKVLTLQGPYREKRKVGALLVKSEDSPDSSDMARLCCRTPSGGGLLCALPFGLRSRRPGGRHSNGRTSPIGRLREKMSGINSPA